MLMDSLQILHNKAAKIVLNRPVHSLPTQALIDLRWINLRVRRRIHRLVHIFKCLNGLLDHNYHFNTGSLVHNYQTPQGQFENSIVVVKANYVFRIFNSKHGTRFLLKSETMKVCAVLETLFYIF